jgi:hypothetical protein
MAEVLKVIWVGWETEYFSTQGWTRQITLKSLPKIASSRDTISGSERMVERPGDSKSSTAFTRIKVLVN